MIISIAFAVGSGRRKSQRRAAWTIAPKAKSKALTQGKTIVDDTHVGPHDVVGLFINGATGVTSAAPSRTWVPKVFEYLVYYEGSSQLRWMP
jgi:hypothetical protein